MVLVQLLLPAGLLLAGLGRQEITGQSVSPDSVFAAFGAYTEATALLEKTIFKFDVALLTLRLGPETTAQLGEAARARGVEAMDEAEVAELAIRSRDAAARLEFLRGIGFQRFLDGIRDGLEAATKAGWVDREFARDLSEAFPRFYAPLRERGVEGGDAMFYFIRGDTLRTVFQTREGKTVVDQIDVGSRAVLSVLGGFLSPGSDFRKGLLESLLRAIL
jgi:hypothetical protein